MLFWWVSYEAVYLHDLEDGFKAQRVIGEWMERAPGSCIASP